MQCFATIRAPISGTVASVSTQQGETVAASFAAPTFVTIVDDRALELVAMVDETDIAGVAPEEPIIFSVEAYPGREFKATVRRIDPTALIVSGVVNYPVIAEIDAKASDLKPDMTANIVITKVAQTALTLQHPSGYSRGTALRGATFLGACHRRQGPRVQGRADHVRDRFQLAEHLNMVRQSGSLSGWPGPFNTDVRSLRKTAR